MSERESKKEERTRVPKLTQGLTLAFAQVPPVFGGISRPLHFQPPPTLFLPGAGVVPPPVISPPIRLLSFIFAQPVSVSILVVVSRPSVILSPV